MDVIRELQNSDFFIRPFPKGTMFPELNKPFKAYKGYGGKADE